MILQQNKNSLNIKETYNFYLKLYELGEEYLREIEIDKNENIDIFQLLLDNNLLSSNDSLNISFEVRENVNNNFLISDLNRTKDEIAFDFSSFNDEEFNDIYQKLNSYDEKPLLIRTDQEVSQVINVVSYRNKKIVFVLNSRNSFLNIGEEISVFYSIYETDITRFLLNEQSEVTPSIILSNNRKKNLSNYDYEGIKNNNKEKLYEDLNDKIEEFTTEDYLNLKDEINYNFSDFENHVRFGSAYSKVSNINNKINDIEEYQNKLDNTTSISSGSQLSIKNEIRDIVDNFTLYEKYVYKNIYNQKTTSEYNNWINDEKEEAELYDLQNEEFILYLFPPDIIENDDTGYFTNFVLLMGEFFDNIWLYIESLSNIKEKNFYSDYQISSNFVNDVFHDLGIYKEIKYTDESLTDYFTGTDNLKKVSDIISRRLLYNLPFLYKSKGTISVIKQLINIFGVPSDILDIYEFGSSKTGLSGSQFFNDYEWYLQIEKIDDIFVNISNSDINLSEHTFEFVINNIESDGKILQINDENYIEIENSGSIGRLNIYNNGILSEQTDYFLKNNDQWTYIGINRDTNDSGSVYSWQQEKSGYGIVNGYSSSFAWNSSSYGTYSNVELMKDLDGSITEFRLYNSALLKKEAKTHAEDVRSIAEEELPETLENRIKFYKPDDDTYNSLNSIEGAYNVTLNNINESNFKIDEFFNYSYIKYIPTEDGRTNNVRIEDRVNTSESLTRDIRTTRFEYEEFSNDSNILGVFLSPTDKLNMAIIRRIGDYVDLVPSDLEEDDKYRFSTLEENKKYLKDIPDSYSNLYIYNSLLGILNQRLFKLLNDFVPASSQLEYGLLIKNHILNKIKGRSETKSAEAHLNYEISIDSSKKFNNEEYQNNYQEVEIINSSKTSKSFIDEVNLHDRHDIKINSDNSNIQKNITNEGELFTDYYTKMMIKGYGSLPPDPDEVESLNNAGASILVT